MNQKSFLRSTPGREWDQPCSMVPGGLPAQDIVICDVALVRPLSLSEPVSSIVTYSE